MPRTDTRTLTSAMRTLSREIQSGDGVANAAIAEAADRLDEMDGETDTLATMICRELAGNHFLAGDFGGACEVVSEVLRAQSA